MNYIVTITFHNQYFYDEKKDILRKLLLKKEIEPTSFTEKPLQRKFYLTIPDYCLSDVIEAYDELTTQDEFDDTAVTVQDVIMDCKKHAMVEMSYIPESKKHTELVLTL